MLLCQRCKDIQKTCCQESHIRLTLGDVARITQFCGRDDFYELQPVAEPSQQEIQESAYDPNWLRYTARPNSTSRLLKTSIHGRCTFLGPDGCDLPVEVRPLICRLYPYLYNEFGLIGLALNEHMICPLHALKEGERPLEMLHLPPQEAERWREMLYSELRDEVRQRAGG